VLYAFPIADMSRTQKLMDYPSEELFLAHDEVFLGQAYTFEGDRAYYFRVSINQSQSEITLTAAR
jgi:hypothetical protein